MALTSEAMSQALNGNRDDFFTKTDAALDQLIARYSEHIFKDASPNLMTDGEQLLETSWARYCHYVYRYDSFQLDVEHTSFKISDSYYLDSL